MKSNREESQKRIQIHPFSIHNSILKSDKNKYSYWSSSGYIISYLSDFKKLDPSLITASEANFERCWKMGVGSTRTCAGGHRCPINKKIFHWSPIAAIYLSSARMDTGRGMLLVVLVVSISLGKQGGGASLGSRAMTMAYVSWCVWFKESIHFSWDGPSWICSLNSMKRLHS